MTPETSRMKMEPESPQVTEPITIEICETQVMDACIELVAVNGCPLGLVEYSGFRKLINPILSSLGTETFTINAENLRNRIAPAAANLVYNVEAELQNNIICLKLNMINKFNSKFLIVNAQFIKYGKLNVYTLSVNNFTGKNLIQFTEVVLRILEKYNITQNQVYNIVIDSNIYEEEEILRRNYGLEGSYLDASYFDIRKESVCLSRKLQNFLETFFSSVNINCYLDAYKDAKQLKSLKEDYLAQKLLHSSTHWTSSADMLKAMSENTKCLEGTINIGDLTISNDDTKKLNSLYECLKPINELWSVFQKEDLTLSDFYSMFLECEIKLKNLSNDFVAKLTQILKKMESNILCDEQMLAAIFLDPRYQLLLTEDQKMAAKIHLEQLWEEMRYTLVNEVEMIDTNLQQPDNDDELENLLKRKEMELDVKKPTTLVEVHTALIHFDGVQRLSRKENILKYWEDNKTINPVLYELSRAVFAMPATHATHVRAEAALDLICQNNKQSLSDGTLEDMLLIKLNHQNLL